MKNLYTKLKGKIQLSYEDALKMLEVSVFSEDYYKVINYANSYARHTFQNKGTIFAQIGIDATPCSVNCQFCQLAVDNFIEQNKKSMIIQEIVQRAVHSVHEGANEIFIMATAEYDDDLFLKVGEAVRYAIPKHIRMVANIDDFDVPYARKLKDVGFTGVYHICRLDEGIVTQANVEKRIHTLDAIKKTDLELYYCVEPIGPEHTNEQIADEILRAIDYHVNVMAVMRRVCFDNSPMLEHGEISAAKMALICAVTVLCVRPNRAMGVHEPEIISLIAGANQIYAEAGANPRDLAENTESSRGFTVKMAKEMLKDAEWELLC